MTLTEAQRAILTDAVRYVEGMDSDWCYPDCDICKDQRHLLNIGLLSEWDEALWVTPAGMEVLKELGVVE